MTGARDGIAIWRKAVVTGTEIESTANATMRTAALIEGMAPPAGIEAHLLVVIHLDAQNTTMTMTVGGKIALIVTETVNTSVIGSVAEIVMMIEIIAKIVIVSETETGNIAMIDIAARDTLLIRPGQIVTVTVTLVEAGEMSRG